jgi:hypothetical protein
MKGFSSRTFIASRRVPEIITIPIPIVSRYEVCGLGSGEINCARCDVQSPDLLDKPAIYISNVKVSGSLCTLLEVDFLFCSCSELYNI